MKILNIMTGGLRREGITATQLEIIKNMDTKDIQMHIAAVHRNASDVISDFEKIGCRVCVLPDRKRSLFFYIIKLYSLIKSENYDIVHVHGSSSMLAIELSIAKLAGVPVRIAHSRNTKTNNILCHKILYPIFDKSYTHALSCGIDAGNWLFRNRKFTIVHNGKDLNNFKFKPDIRKKIRDEYNLGQKTTIGFVGNFNKQKNLFFLLEVFEKYYKKNSGSVLFLIGDGKYRKDIEKKINNMNMSSCIILTGRIRDVWEILNAMDVMLLPSLYEGLPNVVLEWQASGLKSFVSDKVTKECAVCELVEFLPIDKGTDVWVNKIEGSILDMNREQRSEFGCKSLIKANFEIKSVAEFMRKFYFESLSSSLNMK